jgi:hypothetical protein
LVEFAKIYEDGPFPMLVGDDFNIIRRKEDKNNNNFNVCWSFILNAINESLDLREIAL